MNQNVKTIGEFDLNNAIDRTAAATGLDRKTAKIVVNQFLYETEVALAEHGRVEFSKHFSITLRKRAPRKGTFKGVPWETPARVEPEFQAFGPLKILIQEKQGIECI